MVSSRRKQATSYGFTLVESVMAHARQAGLARRRSCSIAFLAVQRMVPALHRGVAALAGAAVLAD